MAATGRSQSLGYSIVAMNHAQLLHLVGVLRHSRVAFLLGGDSGLFLDTGSFSGSMSGGDRWNADKAQSWIADPSTGVGSVSEAKGGTKAVMSGMIFRNS